MCKILYLMYHYKMSFLSNLDEEGKQIYNDYILHIDKWVKYIKPISKTTLNTYIVENKKYYNQNEYLYFMYREVINDTNLNKEHTPELNGKYKKLCLLFHPDKFKNPLNNEFFMLIKKFYIENNCIVINLIDIIAHFILELDDLQNIINNLNNLNNYKNIELLRNNTNPDYIFSILNNSSNSNCQEFKNEEDEYTTFLNSTEYLFYTNNTSAINYINDTYLDEIQFIEKINKCTQSDINFIKFSIDRYKSNENIMIALYQCLEKLNLQIKTENDNLKSLLQCNEKSVN